MQPRPGRGRRILRRLLFHFAPPNPHCHRLWLFGFPEAEGSGVHHDAQNEAAGIRQQLAPGLPSHWQD